MRVANLRMDGQISSAHTALTLGDHMQTGVHGMNLERRIGRKKPQRNIVRA